MSLPGCALRKQLADVYVELFVRSLAEADLHILGEHLQFLRGFLRVEKLAGREAQPLEEQLHDGRVKTIASQVAIAFVPQGTGRAAAHLKHGGGKDAGAERVNQNRPRLRLDPGAKQRGHGFVEQPDRRKSSSLAAAAAPPVGPVKHAKAP